MSEGRERRVERAQRDLQIAEALHSRGGGTVGKFEAKLHPRDRTGKWRETFASPERAGMGSKPIGRGPRVQQDFARGFGGPQSTATGPPDSAPPSTSDLKAHAMANGGSASNAIDFAGYYREHGLSVSPEAAWVAFKNDPREFPNGFTTHVGDGTATRATVRRDERPNALSPEEHQFARGFGDIPTDVAGLREFRARVAERIPASPDDGGPRFRAQTRKLQASTVKKIDAAIRSGRGLIIPQAPAAPAPAPRPDPYAARLASIKDATGLDVTEPEAGHMPFGAGLNADLRAIRASVAEPIARSPDDGGPEFRRRAREAQRSLLAKIDAAIRAQGRGSSARTPGPLTWDDRHPRAPAATDASGNEVGRISPMGNERYAVNFRHPQTGQAYLGPQGVAGQRTPHAYVYQSLEQAKAALQAAHDGQPIPVPEAPNRTVSGRRQRRTFQAFGVTRKSEADYSHASRDANGAVRFHTSESAARRRAGSGQVMPTEVVTGRAAPAIPNIVGAPGSAFNPHPGARVQIHTPNGKVLTGSSLGNGLAFVQGRDIAGGAMTMGVYHIKHGVGMGSIGAAGRDASAAKYAFQRHWAGANTNQTVEQLRVDPDIKARALNMRAIVDATDTQAHRDSRAAEQARAQQRLAPTSAVDAALAAHDAGTLAAHIAGLSPEQRALTRQGAQRFPTIAGVPEILRALDGQTAPMSPRERRVQAELSGDRGQRTGARVGGREGRWLTIKGKKKHIPRGADWTHEDGGARFDSPTGGTDVYRTGPDGVRELVSQPGQRGTHADVRQIQHHSRGGAPAPAPAPAPASYTRGDRVSYNGLNLIVLGTRGDQVHVSNPGGTSKRWLPAADVTRGESAAPAAPLSDVSVPGQAVDSAAERRRQNDAFTEPGRSRRDPVMAARIDALKAMSPGEHRVIDGAYVKREADNTYTVHHGYGSERYRTRNDVPGPGRNQGLGDYFAPTRDARMSQLADVLRSIDQASQGAANAPNIMMTPMVQAGQMQSRLEVGDKVAVRWTGSGSQSGGNAVVKRINRASAVVTIDGGPQSGQDITIPLHDPGRQNRWSVNNRIVPRGAEIDRHVSRQASTPIRGDRLLQQATRDTGNRVTNAPREASGRIAYLVDGKGPYTAMEALAALGLPASGATPAEYEAWRRSQGVREATFTAEQRRKLADKGKAMPHGGFPIRDLADLKNAIQALGRAKNRAAAQRHIIKRAHALGLVSALPTDWKVREADVDARERRIVIEQLANDPALIALAEAHDKGAEPFSTSKTSNWVAKAGGLPHYIQHIAHDLMEKRGMDESRAIAMAIGIVKRWARGGGKVKPDTRAAAAKAVAEWEAKKAKAHAA